MLFVAVICSGIILIANVRSMEAFRWSVYAQRRSSLVSIVRFLGSGSDFERNESTKIERTVTKSTDEDDAEKQAYLEELRKSPTKEISDDMRRRLLREMQGNDPNFSRGPILGNPILLISIIVAVLVLLGGKDILF